MPENKVFRNTFIPKKDQISKQLRDITYTKLTSSFIQETKRCQGSEYCRVHCAGNEDTRNAKILVTPRTGFDYNIMTDLRKITCECCGNRKFTELSQGLSTVGVSTSVVRPHR
jgi:hypothetical protein